MQVSRWPSKKRAFSNEINLESEMKSKDTSSGSNLKSKDLLWKQSGIKRYKFRKQSGTKKICCEIKWETLNWTLVMLDSFTVEIKAIWSLREDYLLDRYDRSFSSEINRKLQQKIWIGKQTAWYHDTDQLSAELSDWSLLIGEPLQFVLYKIHLSTKKKQKRKKK